MEASETRSVTLRAEQWQQILAVLNDAPYRLAAPLINEVVQQCTQSDQASTTTPQTWQRGNGIETTEQPGK